MNRFLNRLMLLRLEEQNNLFDLFQKIYDELIRVDKEDD